MRYLGAALLLFVSAVAAQAQPLPPLQPTLSPTVTQPLQMPQSLSAPSLQAAPAAAPLPAPPATAAAPATAAVPAQPNQAR
jgi:hypothetical protein